MDNSDPNLECDKILRKYIHDYFVKKKLYDTAAIFAHEAEVSENKEDVIDYAPQGFLLEWWSVFWALFTSTAEGIPQTIEGSSDQSNPDANQWRSLIAFANEYLRKVRDEKRALGMPSSSHAYAGPYQQQIPDDAQQQTAMGALGGVNLGGTSFVGSMFSGFQSMSPEARVVGEGLFVFLSYSLVKFGAWPSLLTNNLMSLSTRKGKKEKKKSSGFQIKLRCCKVLQYPIYESPILMLFIKGICLENSLMMQIIWTKTPTKASWKLLEWVQLVE